MASIMVGDMRIYYAEAGHRDGSPLVRLHAFNGAEAAWAPQLDALGALDFLTRRTNTTASEQ